MEYKIVRGDSLSKIAKKHRISVNQLIAANPRYRADPNKISIGDSLSIPIDNRAVKKKTRAKKKVSKKTSASRRQDARKELLVPFGQLTFDAEGMETSGPYFSRKPHVPSSSSGVTIGRGYDMKNRSEDEILDDLLNASVTTTKAGKLAQCGGYKGNEARAYLEENRLVNLSISRAEQKALFMTTYQELEGDVLRICRKADVVAKYGMTKWEQLDQRIRDIIVDLRYRGDYTGSTRQRVQPAVVGPGDFEALKLIMQDSDFWLGRIGVPRNRFNRRITYLG